MREMFVAALLVPMLAGCLASESSCGVPEGPALDTPALGQPYTSTESGQAWDALVLRNHPDVATWNATVAPDGWHVEARPLSEASPLEILRVTPGTGAGNLSLEWRVQQADAHCVGSHSGFLRWNLAAPTAGVTGHAGQGVRVWYAGFWENGTMFETNIPELDHASWPRAGWYESIPYATLPVYIYDQERSERSPLWSASTGGTPAGPVTGNAGAWNYYTTINGFNDGLKGLSTHTTRVLHLEAKDAYPEPVAGHPAGIDGVPLIFYLHVESVQDLPCPDDPMVPCVTGSLPV